MSRWLIPVVLLVVGSACAHRTGERAPINDRNLISKEELTRTNFSSLYEAVQSLRRTWLQGRGPDSFNAPTQVKVYLDNSLLGGVDMLRNITPASISYVRYFDGLTATTRWGLDHGAGVIFVSTRPTPVSP